VVEQAHSIRRAEVTWAARVGAVPARGMKELDLKKARWNESAVFQQLGNDGVSGDAIRLRAVIEQHPVA